MPNVQVNDGSVQFGSRTLTINAVQYATDDFSIEAAFSEITRTNALEILTGRVTTKGAVTGSATLQLATTSTVAPDFGMQFTETIEGVATTFTIQSVGRVETKGGESKVPIKFVKNITATIAIT